MSHDGKLLFDRPHDGQARLVFGDAAGGTAPAAPEARLAIDASLPGLGRFPALRVARHLGVDAALPGLDGFAGLLWDANVSRGHAHRLRARWQDAVCASARAASAWQDAPAHTALAASHWQDASARQHASAQHWQAARPQGARASAHWQDATARQHALAQHWQEARRLAHHLHSHWQAAAARQHTLAQHWQEMRRLAHGLAGHWQDARPLGRQWGLRVGDGLALRLRLASHWQDGRPPPPGASRLAPPATGRDPCFDPATLGTLVFMDAWGGPDVQDGAQDGTQGGSAARLVFVCQRPGTGLPPARVFVIPRRSFVVINHIDIRRADTGEPLPAEAFGMQIDRDSWTWSFTATFHRDARAALMPAGGAPVELLAQVNGQPFRLLAERLGRSVRFPERLVKVSGRGRSALLDAPHAPVQSFGVPAPRTAHQLMLDVLTVNGVDMGWTVDWGLTDWPVPAGAWLHQGSWASAICDIAAAAGGYVQPHDTDTVLRILPAWPRPWWDWASLPPDVELPAGSAEVEETEWIDRPAYDRVFVSGEGAGGVLGDYKRAGAAGSQPRPMAVHPLITAEPAARQRATAELADAGRLIHQALTLMVLPETGVIKPGTLLRYTDDDGAPRLGLVRSTAVQWSHPVLTQTIGIESHA